MEEFADPIVYLTKIEPLVRRTGICKVIPPRGAKPTWNEDVWRKDVSTFETKLQNVHKLSEGRLFQFGKLYTKSGYKAMAMAFEKEWAEGRADFDACDVNSVERAFWNMVETQEEKAAVEYGNDLDTKEFGTGFGVDAHGERHPWDFEHLYSHPLNLLRVIEHDIPGLTKPWLYLGMLFATFCWHVEDHFLCSVNYLHTGASKTWYGVPGSDAEAFENCARATVPRLFQQAPDILHQIVTMVPPGILIDHGVKVVHTVQHPGEFIVTFPRAYHAGFSHGFNVAEAVNFGHANWLDHGRRAIDVYSTGSFKRNAVFAHHRLLARAAETFAEVLNAKGLLLKSKVMGTVIATLCKELESIVSDEEIYRSSLVRRGLKMEVVALPNEDDDACCIRCKAIPFLSVVRCKCLPTAVRCLRHAMDGCDCAASERCLEVRVMGSYIRGLLRSLLLGEPVEKAGGMAEEKDLEKFVASVKTVAVIRSPSTTAAPPASKKSKLSDLDQTVEGLQERIEERQALLSRTEGGKVWTSERAKAFDKAAEQLGGMFKATSGDIGKILRDEYDIHASRDQIGSRLQKCRNKLRREQQSTDGDGV